LEDDTTIGRLMGISIILNLLGYKEIKSNVLPSVILTDENLLTSVKVNNGKIYSTAPERPLIRYVPSLNLRVNLKVSSSSDERKFYFWPLNWRPMLTIRSHMCLPGLFITESGDYVGIPKLKPWSTGPYEECISIASYNVIKKYKANLGPVNIEVDRVYKKDNIIFSEDLDFRGNSEEKILSFDKVEELVMNLECYNYYIEFLHPGGWPRVTVSRGDELQVKNLSIIIRCPKGSAFIASPEGVEIKAKPGKIKILSKGKVILGEGSYLRATRSLIESITYPITLNNEVVIGDVRGEAIAVLNYIDHSKMYAFVWNPSEKRSIYEIRFQRPVKEVRFVDPLGEELLPLDRGLIKIPLPPAWEGCLDISLGRMFVIRQR
jgi:hypothetical protein